MSAASRRRWDGVWLPLLLALLVSVNILSNGFTLDADVDLYANPLVTQPGHLGELLTSDYTAGAGLRSGFWRPVVGLLYWLVWRAGGGVAWPFLLLNLTLHLVMTGLVYLLAHQLTSSRSVALATGLLFAAHPVHVDVVAGVVGLKDLLAAVGTIGALLCFMQARSADRRRGAALRLSLGGASLLLVGLLAKESAVAVLPVLAAIEVYRIVHRDRGRWSAPRSVVALQWAGLLAALAIKFGAGMRLIGPGIGIFSIDNPLIAIPPGVRSLYALRLVPFYSKLMVWPQTLSADYSYNALPIATGPLAASHLLGTAILLALLLGAAAALRRAAAAWYFALALLLGAYLPISNLVITLGTYAAERFLYVPSVAGCLLLGMLLGMLLVGPRRPRSIGIALLLLLCTLGSVRSVLRNRDWRDNKTLFFSALAVAPNNLKAAHGAIATLREEHRYDEALALADRLLAYRDPLPATAPIFDDWRPLLFDARGRTYLRAGQAAAAVSDLRAAVAARPDRIDFHQALALALTASGDLAAAAEVWSGLAARRPHDFAMVLQAGLAYGQAGAASRAETFFRAALQLRPTSGAAGYNLAMALIAQQQEAQALTALLDLEPRLAPSDPLREEIAKLIAQLQAPAGR